MKVMNLGLVRRARRIDRLWSVVAFVRRLWQPSSSPMALGQPTSFLVLDLHLIGDAVMLLPFLAAIKRRYPTAQVTVVAGPWNRPVLASDPSIDELIEFSAPWVKGQGIRASWTASRNLVRLLRSKRWDVGIDTRGDIRNILILYFANCIRRVGFDFTGGASLLTQVVPDDGRLASLLEHHERLAACLHAFDGQPFVSKLTLTDQERDSAWSIAPYVGFHFGASLPLRRLPVDEAAKLVAASLSDWSGPALVFSTPDLEAYVETLMAALSPALQGRLKVWRGDLRSFIVAASRAHVLYTMDSGPAHLAAATGSPTVVMFGPNRAEYAAPRGRNVVSVQLDPPLTCQPCDQHKCVHPSDVQACLRGRVPDAVAAGRRLVVSGESLPALSQKP
ncbi:MAG: glycosyltransferase family 9 protein [Ideonella sp. WA131b]|jgi:ADP-heptose:LPS heptosyltransferase|nr:glycosyltransferase family 9 protein [Ideonella sp. WA131b]